MESIDQTSFQFDPAYGIATGVMAAIMVFGISLDLKWDHFKRVLQNPRAIAVGLVAQFIILPAIAYAVGQWMVTTPSIALGLLLVAACPGGAISNFLTA